MTEAKNTRNIAEATNYRLYTERAILVWLVGKPCLHPSNELINKQKPERVWPGPLANGYPDTLFSRKPFVARTAGRGQPVPSHSASGLIYTGRIPVYVGYRGD
jgi:hypothetical protein